MPVGPIAKVTALVMRRAMNGPELLFLRHPHIEGAQLPAGTVEESEKPEDAVLREAREETGLNGLSIVAYFGAEEENLGPDRRIVTARAKVFARPDPGSFNWATLPRGITVSDLAREQPPYSHVSYSEMDTYPDSNYLTMQITGWVETDLLRGSWLRHFYLLEYVGEAPDRWSVNSDNHIFELAWSDAHAPPPISIWQQKWVSDYMRRLPRYLDEA